MRTPAVVVVTGASSRVGRAAARAFAARGASVGLLARSSEGLGAARREAEEFGVRAVAIPTDVADPVRVEAAADAVERELGPIGVWVNNAMVSVLAPVAETDAADFRRVTEVTYLGVVHGTMAALRRMLPRDRGTIVQVGSALAYRGIPLQAAYCGAKHAIQGFTESLRCELIHDGSRVRVTMVQLPALNTPQFEVVRTTLRRHPQPIPPIYQPEVAADAIVAAAEDPRREVIVGAMTAAAAGLNAVAPGFLDRYLARTAYSGQQTDEPIDAVRPTNLYEPVPGDRGAHGRFDDRSRSRGLQVRPATLRGALAAALALVGAGLWGGRMPGRFREISK